jgi:hypothetical protein
MLGVMTKAIPADDLLARTRRVYAECSTYADEGEQTTRIDSEGRVAGGRFTTRRVFRTLWKRPDHFYFEFRDVTVGPQEEWALYAIWATPGSVQSWWTLRPKVETWTTLDMPIAAATGVSGGTAWFVSELLRGIPSGHGVPTVAAGFWGERLELDGSPCLRIPMIMRPGHEQTLWISEKTALLLRVDEVETHTVESRRKMAEESIRELTEGEGASSLHEEDRQSVLKGLREMLEREGSDFTSRSVTLYRPALEVEIEESSFAFVPPTGA